MIDIESKVEEYLKSGGVITAVDEVKVKFDSFPNWKKYTSNGNKKVYQGKNIAAYKALKIMGW